jgi:hypothetical protein
VFTRASGGRSSLTVTLTNIDAPGTYPLGVNLTGFGGTATVGQRSDGWGTPLRGAAGDAGSVVVTSRTATRIKGTFSFDLGIP